MSKYVRGARRCVESWNRAARSNLRQGNASAVASFFNFHSPSLFGCSGKHTRAPPVSSVMYLRLPLIIAYATQHKTQAFSATGLVGSRNRVVGAGNNQPRHHLPHRMSASAETTSGASFGVRIAA